MKDSQITFEQVMNMARQLLPLEKLWLIENLAPDLERALQASTPLRRRSMRGIFKESSISAEDIDQARQEMWNSKARASDDLVSVES